MRRKFDAVADVAIAQGRIAAVEANIAGDAAETIDAKGKLVVPGLIDIHTHAAHVKDGPAMCLADGVTGLIDAGSQGADHISDTHRYRQIGAANLPRADQYRACSASLAKMPMHPARDCGPVGAQVGKRVGNPLQVWQPAPLWPEQWVRFWRG
ncbi:MAG: amidohydrolase family protein [Bryobacterales bacterium]|nr:amidohydrolase family protein [Bryobacterales bacterium]